MYVIAKLPMDKMIRLFPTKPNGAPGRGFASVFHRTSKLGRGVPTHNTLNAAQEALDTDPDSFVMEFDPATRLCAAVWFTTKQQEAEIPTRLHYWAGCYGAFPVRTLP